MVRRCHLIHIATAETEVGRRESSFACSYLNDQVVFFLYDFLVHVALPRLQHMLCIDGWLGALYLVALIALLLAAYVCVQVLRRI